MRSERIVDLLISRIPIRFRCWFHWGDGPALPQAAINTGYQEMGITLEEYEAWFQRNTNKANALLDKLGDGNREAGLFCLVDLYLKMTEEKQCE